MIYIRHSKHQFSHPFLPISKLLGGVNEASDEFHLTSVRHLAYFLINCCSIRLWHSNRLEELMELLKQANSPENFSLTIKLMTASIQEVKNVPSPVQAVYLFFHEL